MRLEATARLALAGGLYGALFVLEGSVAIAESIRARPRTIGARETVLLYPRPDRTLQLRSLGRVAAQVIFLRWRPGGLRNET